MKDIMLSSLWRRLTPGISKNAKPVTVTDTNWLRDDATWLIDVSLVSNCSSLHKLVSLYSTFCCSIDELFIRQNKR